MKLLLTRRANWMQKDLEEMTPLHLTTRHKSPKCLALLLKFMAPGEVDTQDKNKVTDCQNPRQIRVDSKCSHLSCETSRKKAKIATCTHSRTHGRTVQVSICPHKAFHLNSVVLSSQQPCVVGNIISFLQVGKEKLKRLKFCPRSKRQDWNSNRNPLFSSWL